jgi:release factor glutamine methyltransferase
MKISDLIKEAVTLLNSYGIAESLIEAELIVMKSLGMTRSELYVNFKNEIDTQTLDSVYSDLNRRYDREPWPYICGFKEFYGIDILMSPGVFIPRPETELLIDLTLDIFNSIDDNHRVNIADVCTGSGAIAIALASHLSNADIYAVDSSKLALQLAQRNIETHGLENHISILEGNLLDPLDMSIDILVSNPPYIPSKDIPGLEPEVLHEPIEALDGGADGLEIIRNLMLQASHKIRRPGNILIEFSPQQNEDICQIAKDILSPCIVKVENDLSGKNRVLVIGLT